MEEEAAEAKCNNFAYHTKGSEFNPRLGQYVIICFRFGSTQSLEMITWNNILENK